MPSHIIVNNLALTYKSTIGVSQATLPDVCKTPTPGGPVPIPYPNFANQGSLDKGTTTVKAKGNMIAIKGSEYSISFGDEPGTIGGVTSNTFKKETAWITYSFDVKMDGQNACRNTDKKFHNHKNTVDLAGNIDPGSPGGNALEIKCADAPAAEGAKKFTKCEKEEICAKCAAINKDCKKLRKEGKTPRRARASYEKNRRKANNKCKTLNKQARNGKPAKLGFHEAVSDECKKTLLRKAKETNYRSVSADHVQEIQLGGHPSAHSNLKWMSRRPNSWIGGEMKKFETTGPNKNTGVKPDCC